MMKTIPIATTCTVAYAASGAGKTVIYVDDQAALVFLVTRILERRGYTVLGFTNPSAALNELAARSNGVDVLISDLAMPGMTGFELAQQAHEICTNLPVILMSSRIRSADIERAQQMGVRRLLDKDHVVEELAPTLRAVLEDRRSANVA